MLRVRRYGSGVRAEHDYDVPIVERPLSPPSPARRAGCWLLAAVLLLVGVVAGWLIVKGILALPLPEAALFGLSGLAAIAVLAGVVRWRRLWGRALLVGGFIGITGSIGLVLLFVMS